MLYGCGAWSLTLREECRLRIFENRILRRIFRPMISEQSEKISNLEDWNGHVARMEEGRSAFQILTGKPTGNRPLERPRRRWEQNIRMDLKEIGINTRNWVVSAQDRGYWESPIYIFMIWIIIIALSLLKYYFIFYIL